DEPVEQRRFSRVRAADERDESGAGHLKNDRRVGGLADWRICQSVDQKKTQPTEVDWVHRGAGDGLLSRGLSTGVPSALSGLTTVFGMGTGVAPTLESPASR